MRYLLPAVAMALMMGSVFAADRTLTVSAGKLDRINTVVAVTLPPDMGQGNFGLRDAQGTLELQRITETRAVFILPSLKAGQSRTFTIERVPAASRPPLPTDVQLRKERTTLAFLIGTKPVLTYNGEKTPLPEGYDPAFQRGGYIYPVFTPTGKLISDDYPPKHKHHHGIWSPWTSTVFEGRKVDFWNMGQKTGTVEFVKLANDEFAGAIAGGFSAKHRMVDLKAPGGPKAAIDEDWQVTIYSVPGEKPYFLFDLVDTQNCATDSPLVLPKYHYGGLGFRGPREWEGKGDKCLFITSEGKDRSNGNETRGKWCWVGGKLGDAMGGVAILDHPANFRHPQPMRLNPDEPFFCYAPSQLGEWKIEPGKPYLARYRFIVSDGGIDKELIERLWNDYATPPEVTIK